MGSNSAKLMLICMIYNNHREVADFVQMLSKLSKFEDTVITLVENSAQADPTFEESIRAYANVVVYYPGKNLGYFGGAQFALESYKKNQPLSEYVIISNSDINIEDQFFFEKILSLKLSNDVAVIAPSIISMLTNEDQNPGLEKRPASLKIHFLAWVSACPRLFFLYGLLNSWKCQLKGYVQNSKKFFKSSARPIYLPFGAFIIFRKRYFDRGLNYKTGFFLYQEELFVAEESRLAGLIIQYEPSLRVFHAEHSVTGILPTKKKANLFHESMKFCYLKYFKGK